MSTDTLDARERDRLAALRSYRILDTAPEQAFDDLALIASQICATPIALISLVDEDRQWFKARVGVTATQTARDIAFCAHAIQQPGLFVVPDALLDARFKDNPLVTSEPKVRFYTGAPLVTPEGHALGTLCVIDRKPRNLTPDQQEALDALQRQVVAQLELRRNLIQLRAALLERDRAEQAQGRLIADLRASLEQAHRLGGLVAPSNACLLNVVMPAALERVRHVTKAVMDVVRSRGETEDDPAVEVSIEEALTNAIKHGCGNDAAKQVQCCVSVDERGELVVIVRDPGPGFDPAAVPSPLIGPGLLKESGRGIYMINQFMDEVRFRDGGREIEMRKHRANDESPLPRRPTEL